MGCSNYGFGKKCIDRTDSDLNYVHHRNDGYSIFSDASGASWIAP